MPASPAGSGQFLVAFTAHHNSPPASNAATPNSLGSTNPLPCLDFVNTANSAAIFEAVMPTAYDGNTGNGITVTLTFSVDTTTGNVKWIVDLLSLAVNVDPTAGTFGGTAQNSGAIAVNATSGDISTCNITLTYAQTGSIPADTAFRLRVQRDTTVVSNAAATAHLIAVEVREA